MRELRRWAVALGRKLAGSRRWLVVAAAGVVVVVLVTVVAVVGGDDGGRPPSRVLGAWVEPDQYGRAPACDGFSRETLATLGPLPAGERAGGAAHAYCGWPNGSDGFLYVMVNVHPADGSGAAKAQRWLAAEPGEPVTSPDIGDAAKLQRHDEGCTLQFRRSNLIARIGFIADRGGACDARVLALGAEFASRLPRAT